MFSNSAIMRVLITQYAFALGLSLCLAVFVGKTQAWSALGGGLAYAIPTTLVSFAFMRKHSWLRLQLKGFAFLVGEVFKILVVIVSMAMMVEYYENLSWLWFIVSLILVSNSYLLLLIKRN